MKETIALLNKLGHQIITREFLRKYDGYKMLFILSIDSIKYTTASSQQKLAREHIKKIVAEEVSKQFKFVILISIEYNQCRDGLVLIQHVKEIMQRGNVNKDNRQLGPQSRGFIIRICYPLAFSTFYIQEFIMAKKDDGLHYSLTKLLSYDKTFNFVVSEREPGKSTSIWRLVYGK